MLQVFEANDIGPYVVPDAHLVDSLTSCNLFVVWLCQGEGNNVISKHVSHTIR